MFQFTKGGPIIAFQVENEYGSVHPTEIDKSYLVQLKYLMRKLGTVELLLTSDGPDQGKRIGPIPGVLQTVNFGGNSKVNLDVLRSYQPDKPFMVMEYWIGWFDHWGDRKQNKVPTEGVMRNLIDILNYNSSVNFYMFYGGMNKTVKNVKSKSKIFKTVDFEFINRNYFETQTDRPLFQKFRYKLGIYEWRKYRFEWIHSGHYKLRL